MVCRNEGTLLRRRAELIATTHAQEIWDVYTSGLLVLGTSGYTTADGFEIAPKLVAQTMAEWFIHHEPEHALEVWRWLEGHPPAPVTCVDGTVIREDLVRAVWRRAQ